MIELMLAMLATISVAFAESLPIPKGATSCPHGYSASGSYCVPAQGAQDAIAKPPNGVCPFGWSASGDACLRTGSGR